MTVTQPPSASQFRDLADAIDAAADTLDGIATRTPLTRNARLSDRVGAEVWLKREDLQPVRSYKLRGAYTMMSQLTAEHRAAGVVCASAGNHGQGVAYACQALDIHGRIFVPTTTPRQKRDRMLSLGGDHIELVVVGDTYDDSAAAAAAAAAESGATLVPAFNDRRVMAGQGTVVREIVDQLGAAPDVLIVPIGGGGLASGAIAWLRTHHPATRIVGVEPAHAACMQAALAAGTPVALTDIDTFVDGAAVRRAGDLTFELIRDADIEIVTSDEGRICAEMLAFYQVDGIITEPAGALAAASLGYDVRVEPGQTVAVVVSGGNNDVSRYAEIVERALIWEGRKHYFLVNFPQEPGALRRFLDEVLGPDDDITLFEYTKRSNRETGPAIVGIELGDPESLPELLQRMTDTNIDVETVDPHSPFYRLIS